MNRITKKRIPQATAAQKCCRFLYLLTVISLIVIIIYTIVTQYGPYLQSISSIGNRSYTDNDHTSPSPPTQSYATLIDQNIKAAETIVSEYATSKLKNVQNFVQNELSPLLTETTEFVEETPGPLPDCFDPVWCNIPMPMTSSYKFLKPPDNERRWKIAQSQAANGELVLLKEISKVFPNPFDFLDGDRHFRRLHQLIDIFIDEKSGIEALLPSYFEKTSDRRLMEGGNEDEPVSDGGPKEDRTGTPGVVTSHLNTVNGSFPWELEHRRVVPVPYNYRYSLRAPIIQLGYNAFRKDFNEYFSGNFDSGAYINRNAFIAKWEKIKDQLDVPFITVCTLNENWGMLSTMVPNRTAAWGNCCDRRQDRKIYDFLNHPKTLMLAVNQHTNLSHPKILVLPRGIPLTWEKTSYIVWDLIRYSIENIKKRKLLFASSSSWGPRPQILRCVSSKMSVEDFEGHDQTPQKEMKKTKVNRRRYYEKLASSRFGLSLPGLGYDTFRMWELLTMGSIVVIERGIGFDRTLWKLPALLLDDFADITPELLRTAYVEALYHAKEFEFERLKQSFWWTVFANVSKSMSIEPLLDKFPMEAEEPNFARPLKPYECGKTNTCPPETKRTPKVSC